MATKNKQALDSDESNETQLENVIGKLGELTLEHADQTMKLDGVQSQFVKGALPLDAVLAEQSKLNLINQTIEQLEQTQVALENNIQAAQTAAARLVKLKEAKQVAEDGEKAFLAYHNAISEMEDSLKTTVRKLYATYVEASNKRVEFSSIAKELDSVSRTTDAELFELGLSTAALGAVRTDTPLDPDMAVDRLGLVADSELRSVQRAARSQASFAPNPATVTFKGGVVQHIADAEAIAVTDAKIPEFR